MRNSLFKMIAAAMLAALSTYAGSFNSDFSNPAQTGINLAGGQTPTGLDYPAITDGHLVLTFAENSLTASAVLDDLDAGSPIDSFTARFKLQIGPGSGNPADGVSFAFGPEVIPGVAFSEEGPGGMTAGIAVVFDTYDNGGNEAPAIDVNVAGTIIAHYGTPKTNLVQNRFVDVLIQVNRSGTLNMVYDGQVIYTNLVLTGWTPTAGQFGFGARTGGENANQWIDDLNITTTVAGAAVAPSISAQPVSLTTNELSSVTFSVGFDGSAPLSFQWTKNGTAIPDATNSALILPRVLFADNGARYAVTISNAAGTTNSQEATLTVTPDTSPLTIASVKGSADFRHVTVTFSKPVAQATAETIANYSIAGLTVSAATLDPAEGRSVLLTTSLQASGTNYTITVNNVRDVTTGGVTIAPNTQVAFTGFVYATGFAVIEIFENMGFGGSVDSLNQLRDTVDTLVPTRTVLNAAAETPTWENGSNQGMRMQGVLIPPQTGQYIFHIASDDQSYLFLSTDETPANLGAEPIASVATWTNQREWTKEETQTSAPISLTAGQRYFFRALAVEGTGGDGIAVGWELPNAPGTTVVPSGTNLAALVNPGNSTVTITRQPASIQGVETKNVTFTVAATGTSDLGTNLLYQWQRNGANIPGATGASFTITNLTTADNNTTYRVLISVPGRTETSAEATLTVVPDTFPPVVSGAGALSNGSSFDVGVQFDEQVTEASAIATANYTLSSGTISGIRYLPKSPGVVLTVSGLTAGSQYTLTVKDVADLKGNVMASTSQSFTASGMRWGVVGGNEQGATNAVLAVSTNGFDIYSDGVTEWAAYDEATFVYEEITGDFDKKLRVEYQDNSSQWARAGLIARDVTNIGVDRATQEGGAAGRYQKVHVNPVMTAMGTAGNNSWEGNRRLDTGGQTTSAGGNGIPQYPNAWVRLQRQGDVFTIYRSDDGVNWTQLGQTTFTEPMPATLFVGPEFSPENGNIDEALRGTWLAKIRDYGDTATTPGGGAQISATRGPNGLTITFTGSLESADSITGPWTPVTGTSPLTVPTTGPGKFYRARQ